MKSWKQFWQKKQNKKIGFYYVLAFLLFITAIILNFCMGAAKLSLKEIGEAIQYGATSASGRIFWYARFPRVIACLLAGAALAVSGVIIQNVLTNKLASPSIIGVNAGAGLAVTICLALGSLSGWMIAGASFLGALIAVILVAFVSKKIGASRTTVILGGVAVNSCLNAASEAITILIPEVGVQSGDFRVGGFSSVVSARLIPAGILIIAAWVIIFTLSNELDVMSLGEETAQGLGMEVRKMRIVFLGIAALLAGAAVSFAGLLGFVGLIVPHMGRKLVTGDSRFLLPFCAIAGAGFVSICDLLARTLFSPYEIPVGILMSFIGGPFFLCLLARKKGGHGND